MGRLTPDIIPTFVLSESTNA
ncbi:hypothetical protein IL54_2285 [Sphingobium sp. ba1]|nr:hypothetical protein IL54_2285 [Sphingobium sp. ba1]